MDTVTVTANGERVTFELNGSPAARSLVEQLPLTLEIGDFSSNEKTLYPPERLDIEGTPLAQGGGAGTLAYYEPWGGVVMYYDSFAPHSGVYELGRAIEGADRIGGLTGEGVVSR